MFTEKCRKYDLFRVRINFRREEAQHHGRTIFRDVKEWTLKDEMERERKILSAILPAESAKPLCAS